MRGPAFYFAVGLQIIEPALVGRFPVFESRGVSEVALSDLSALPHILSPQCTHGSPGVWREARPVRFQCCGAVGPSYLPPQHPHLPHPGWTASPSAVFLEAWGASLDHLGLQCWLDSWAFSFSLDH